jgi:hypothetical protein
MSQAQPADRRTTLEEAGQPMEYWNHNVHYQPVIPGAVPQGAPQRSTSAAVTGCSLTSCPP